VESASAQILQAKGPGQNFSGAPRYDDRRSVSLLVGLGRSSATVECRGRAPGQGVWERANSKRIGVTSLTFRGHVIGHLTISSLHLPFPVGGPLELSLYF